LANLIGTTLLRLRLGDLLLLLLILRLDDLFLLLLILRSLHLRLADARAGPPPHLQAALAGLGVPLRASRRLGRGLGRGLGHHAEKENGGRRRQSQHLLR
jgi:hypothetical protein